MSITKYIEANISISSTKNAKKKKFQKQKMDSMSIKDEDNYLTIDEYNNSMNDMGNNNGYSNGSPSGRRK